MENTTPNCHQIAIKAKPTFFLTITFRLLACQQMPRKSTKRTEYPQTTVRLDETGRAAEAFLTEVLGSPTVSWTVRFALVELAQLARLIKKGAMLVVKLPDDEGEVVLSLNQIKQDRGTNANESA